MSAMSGSVTLSYNESGSQQAKSCELDFQFGN